MNSLELISLPTRQWAQNAIGRIGRSLDNPSMRSPRARKFILIHLDGVPRALLDDAIAQRRMPFFSSLVRSGAYALDTAFWGSPASTPCFQAGLLYGIRHSNLPAYHWYERELGRVVRMNHPKDAVWVESRLVGARPESLLSKGGTTYLSLFQAEASNQLNMTSLANLRRMAKSLSRDMRGLLTVSRQGAWGFLWNLLQDTLQAGVDVRRWVRGLSGDGRHEREYLLNRFFMIQLAWGLAHSRALIDMVRGVPSIYLVFGNYDEVAHRRGPTSRQATAELYRLDQYLEQIYAFAQMLDEPYDVYFLTDHGHVDSAPLEARIGARLESFLLQGPPHPLPKDMERALLDGRFPLPEEKIKPVEEPVVIEAGNFSHVYLSGSSGPLEARVLLSRYRDVLARAASLPDVGIVALRRGKKAVAIVQNQVYGPSDIGSAPLSTEFSKRAVADFLEELPYMPTAGDLVLFGNIYQPGGTVGFAWEFGSHGGLTRIETDSVVCWPQHAPVDLSALGHASQLYQRFMSAYRS